MSLVAGENNSIYSATQINDLTWRTETPDSNQNQVDMKQENAGKKQQNKTKELEI